MTHNQCTYLETGNKYIDQYYRHCNDCFSSLNEGACIKCVEICHKGHNLNPIQYGPFFCDCGEQGLCNNNFKIKKSKTDTYIPNISSNQTTINQTSFTTALKLFNILEKDKIFSPLNLVYALSLVHLGALGNTEKQMTEFFGRKHSIEELKKIKLLFNNNTIKMANALLVNKDLPIKKEYLNLIGNVGLVSSEDFYKNDLVAKKVNEFIEKNTNGLIKNVISAEAITPVILSLLISTIYFKANWLHKFIKSNTIKSVFNNSFNTMVDLMNLTNEFPYYENNLIQMIEMPYVGDEFCMGSLLPKNPNNDSLSKINLSELYEYINRLSICDVNVFFPKFTHRKKYELVPYLKNLKLIDLFHPIEANLENISERTIDSNNYISNIIHEAVVIVDEEGTEAAAATVVVNRMYITSISIPKPPKIFRADHSFIYYIRHIPTNTIMFIGDYHGN